MSSLRIAVAGSASDPPHPGHIAFLAALLHCGRFDRIEYFVSGWSGMKIPVAPSTDRIMMTILACAELRAHGIADPYLSATALKIQLEDVYGENTPTIRRLERLQARFPHAQILWCTGADAVVPRTAYGGRSEVEALWVDGEKLLAEWPCVVLPRQGFPHPRTFALPPGAEVLDVETPNISSTMIRDLLQAGKFAAHLLSPDIARYIARYGLYRVRSHEQEA